MKQKRASWIIAIFVFLSMAAYGQVKRRNLIGEWIANNHDSIYFKNDTLELHQDANYYVGLESCHLIRWKIEKQSFDHFDIYTCSEPPVAYTKGRESLKLKNKGGKQFLEIKSKGSEIDTFLILDFQEKEVNRYPWDIKTLKLKRI